jgi:murein DD-endopeptidase MepM/ murein hydrolase activator NlpD
MLDAPLLRDLASVEIWDASLERSRRRRVLAAQGRREIARRKQASAAVSAAMVMSPTAAAFAAASSAGGGSVSTASAANRAVVPAAPAHLLRLGSTGPDVVRVQSALGQAPDGVFGPRTDAAVRVFQGRNGLVVDGIVGRHTWGTLFGASGAAYEAATPRYSFKIQRASSSESARVRPALSGRGEVAKIELRTVPGATKPAVVRSHPHRSSQPAAPRVHTEPVRHETRAPSRHHATAPVSSAPVSTSCGSDRITAPVKGYTVTGDFGESRPGHIHAGMDLAVPYGTPIVAAACGVVVQVGSEGGYGNIVCIRHNSTLTTCYAHMSRFATRVGERVHQGEVIGYVGTTGDATGPHVHFETRVNGTPVDPAPYLSGSRRVKTSHAARAEAAKSSTGSSTATRSSSRTSTASASGPGAGETTDKGGSTAKPTASASGPGDTQPSSTVEPTTAPAPAEPAPAPAPAPAAEPAAPAPAPVAAAPAPVEPAPEPVAAAPAPAEPAPAPEPVAAAPAAPADPAPAPEAPAAPADPAPAAEAPAAPAEPAPAAEAPAAPAPEAPAAPAEPAPAAEAPAAPAAPSEAAPPAEARAAAPAG